MSAQRLPTRVENILTLIARRRGVLVSEMTTRGGRSTKAVSDARREAVGRLREEFRFSYPQIGRLLGLHHTTVMYYTPRESRGEVGPVDWSKPDESGAWAI